jgi:hypothetical protein
MGDAIASSMRASPATTAKPLRVDGRESVHCGHPSRRREERGSSERENLSSTSICLGGRGMIRSD